MDISKAEFISLLISMSGRNSVAVVIISISGFINIHKKVYFKSRRSFQYLVYNMALVLLQYLYITKLTFATKYGYNHRKTHWSHRLWANEYSPPRTASRVNTN